MRTPLIAPPSAPRLFVDVQHGLCNRLRVMASAAVLAERTGRDLVVIWRPDHHCEARIGDLLDYPGAVIEDDMADLCRRQSAVVYNYMEIEPGAVFEAPILPDPEEHAGKDVYIRSAYSLNSPLVRMEDEQVFLRGLIPTGAVLDLVGQVRRPNKVALHVRRSTGPGFDHLSFEAPDNWPPERHAELVAWRAKSQPERFMDRLDALIAEGRADTVFVAADHPDTYADFGTRYGQRVTWLDRPDYDRSARQLQYALADLILLTAAELFLASTWSSFSDLAQRLAPQGRAFEQSGKDF